MLLERHDMLQDRAWDTKLTRDIGGWLSMEAARKAARKLRATHQDLFQPGALPTGDATLSGPRMAATSRRGLGRQANQDAAALVTLPNGDRVAIVVDGVSSYPDAAGAADRFAAAFTAEIRAEPRAGRTPEQALRAAHAAALAAMTSRYTPERGHSAVSYAAAHVSTAGTVTTIHVGTVRAYLLTSDAAVGRQLTADHTRGGDITDGGVMTHWSASDHQPEPTLEEHPAQTSGLLVLATDGLWRYLRTPSDLAGVLAGLAPTEPVEAAGRLADASRSAGGRDDHTVAVVDLTPEAGARNSGGDGSGRGTTGVRRGPEVPGAPRAPPGARARDAAAAPAAAQGRGWQRLWKQLRGGRLFAFLLLGAVVAVVWAGAEPGTVAMAGALPLGVVGATSGSGAGGCADAAAAYRSR